MSLTATCPLHENTLMDEKDGMYGVYFSHTIPNVGYCNGKKITPFKKPVADTPVAPKTTPATSETRETVHQETTPYFDMRSYRIERQHSQEMSLRFYTAKGIKDFSTDDIKTMTDWFHKDLDREGK